MLKNFVMFESFFAGVHKNLQQKAHNSPLDTLRGFNSDMIVV